MEATETANPMPGASSAADLSPHDVFAHATDVVWVGVDQEVVVYHTPSSTSYVLNPSAGLLWQCFDGQGSITEILADIADVFQVEPAQLLGEVTPVISGWIESELVIMVDQP